MVKTKTAFKILNNILIFSLFKKSSLEVTIPFSTRTGVGSENITKNFLVNRLIEIKSTMYNINDFILR